MNKWIVFALCSILLTSFGMSDAQEDDRECTGLVFLDGWARPAIEGGNTAIYGTIVNLGQEDERFTGIDSDIASMIELHEVVTDENDVMQMRPLTDGIVIPAGEFVNLEPGALHAMVMNTKHMLEPEHEISATLYFENAGEFTVVIPVEPQEETILYALNTENCPMVGLWGGWTRPARLEGGMSAVYGLLLNLSEEDAGLIGIDSEIAAAAELHETTISDDDVMQMRPLKDGVLIPAGGRVWLEPGAIHIMLAGLEQPLVDSESFDLSLEFDSGETLVQEIKVVDETPDTAVEHQEHQEHKHN